MKNFVFIFDSLFIVTDMFQSVIYVNKLYDYLLLASLTTWWQRCEEERCILLLYSGSSRIYALFSSRNQG